MRQKVQADQGSEDDTGVNQIQFKYCKYCDWNTQTESKVIGLTDKGDWGQWSMCPNDYYMAQIIERVKP